MNIYFLKLSASEVYYPSSAIYAHYDQAENSFTVKYAAIDDGLTVPDYVEIPLSTKMQGLSGQVYNVLAGQGVVISDARLESLSWALADYQVFGIFWNRASGYLKGLIPSYQVNTKSKIPLERSLLIHESCEVARIIVPLKTDKMLDSTIIFHAADLILDGDPFDYTIAGEEETLASIGNSVLPHFLLEQEGRLTPRQNAKVNIAVRDANGIPFRGDVELFIESVNGQISHNRRATVNGETFTTVMAPAMIPGDTVRVKVGTKYVSGLAEIIIPVEEDLS